ncbi:MAG TPA: translation initiation factor IF-2 [Candidatus Choladousia intestinavium]|uniref:Translation initiation factor IF-2 n=1 Tax=Candidatus Choladousia intestinavium TaxID=2840727 RepID=A0A9D1ADM7_9FIRM|nr:translation initiation factor IF-2 [Candidatus Choladousia intestinavium]
MTNIRVHELAKELGRENKEVMSVLKKNGVEVKSHMSNVGAKDAEMVRKQLAGKTTEIKEDENMQKNTEADAAKRAAEDSAAKGPSTDAGKQEAPAHPKKKNIIQVFRPQNSKTGMVKPGSRPRPQGAKNAGPRPGGTRTSQGGSGMKSQAGGAASAGQGAMRRPAPNPQGASASQETKAENTPVKAAEVKVQPAGNLQNTGKPAAPISGQNASRLQGKGTEASSARTQGNRPEERQGSRSQGGRYSESGSGRNQGSRQGGRPESGRFEDRQGGRGQGGRYSEGGSGRNQGSRQGNRLEGGRFEERQGGRGQGSREGGSGRGQGSRQGRSMSIPKAPVESKPLEKESRKRTERGDRNRTEKGEKLERMERNVRQGQKPQKNSQKASKNVKQSVQKPAEKPEETIKNIVIPEKLTIKELADAMKVQPAAIVKKLFLQGTMVTVNQEIDFDKAEEIALEFNCICEKEVKVNVLEELLKDTEDPEETLIPRSPVVCVMGHVDHGKTSLLDAIRNTHVIDKEAGGITQHIGAYVVSIDGQKITFLDTPGHEAFTAMRMRGANATDIAILVVAADDGVMPQTVEAINHAKAAGIEIIVAINKIDKPSANVERVKQELSEYELIPEDWGGSTIFVPVSAHTHEGIDTLLEMILLTAEVSELKANPNRMARGLVIEAELDKGKGPVATVLVQKGTLHVGDPVAAGSCYGKVRAMMDDKGRRVKEAGPSTPVEILGFSDVPNAGEIFMAMDSEKEARSFAETFISEGRERMLEETKSRMSLDDLFSQIQAGNLKELDIIVKADVQGSVEAVKQSLLKLSNEEVIVKIIHGGVGAINESDVILASASNAIIIGFNVRPDAVAKATAEREGVDIRLYRVIYDAIADVEAAMKGMLDPVYEEKVIGHAEVRQLFKASGVGTIAGSYVTDGVFQRGCSIRIFREGKQIYEGALASLKRFKDDVKEVKSGYECGLVFEKFNDVQEEDTVEAYTMVEVPR